MVSNNTINCHKSCRVIINYLCLIVPRWKFITVCSHCLPSCRRYRCVLLCHYCFV